MLMWFTLWTCLRASRKGSQKLKITWKLESEYITEKKKDCPDVEENTLLIKYSYKFTNMCILYPAWWLGNSLITTQPEQEKHDFTSGSRPVWKVVYAGKCSFIAEKFENVYGYTYSKEHSRPQYLMELQKTNWQLFWFVLFSKSLFLF